MGQIETSKESYSSIEPDSISLRISLETNREGIEESADLIEKAKEDLKREAVELLEKIRGLSKDFNANLCNLRFREDKMPDKAVFGIKSKPAVKVRYFVTVYIDTTTRDKDTLSKLFELLLSNANIIDVGSQAFASKELREAEGLKLKAEICKLCRSEAEIIVSSLGSEITGVAKVIYGSSGKFLDASSNKKDSDSLFDEDCVQESDFGDCDFGDCELGGFGDSGFGGFGRHRGFGSSPAFGSTGSFESKSQDNYDKAWASGFVNHLLSEKVTISDKITVVFDIK